MTRRDGGRSRVWWAGLRGLLATAALGGGPASAGYGITDLGTLGGMFSTATAINNRDQVVGQSTTGDPSTRHAFVYSGATGITDLGGLGGSTSLATAIGDDGLIVGYATTAGSALHHAVIFGPGGPTDLDPLLNAVDGEARGVGAGGQVVGTADVFDGSDLVSRAFVVQGGAASWLGTLGGQDAAATGVNRFGQSSGTVYTDGDANYHAVRFDGATARDLGTLGGDNSAATAVNATGWAVGYSQVAGSPVFHAFLHDGTTMHDLGTLGGPESVANAVNLSGDIVGRSYFLDGNNGLSHAFLYSNGHMIDLNTLLPTNSGWELQSATGINDAGLIVGYGINPAGETHAFLLHPPASVVPEPGAAALLLVGLGVVGAARRRGK
jgi:probable HAF family extracellular repeat protein